MPIPKESRSKALIAAEAASAKKAGDILILEVEPLIGITDYFIICSGNTERQVKTITDEVMKKMLERGFKPYRREGEKEARWVLLDYLDIVVHVFHVEEREFYGIERLWRDAATVPFEDRKLA
ncbi:MAG TPA: ribosome silencing factor [Actinomycetota bacterium]|nr:ribosome silencing factor [Actinomycetota bacterium]